jgi:hypothetical protein
VLVMPAKSKRGLVLGCDAATTLNYDDAKIEDLRPDV